MNCTSNHKPAKGRDTVLKMQGYSFSKEQCCIETVLYRKAIFVERLPAAALINIALCLVLNTNLLKLKKKKTKYNAII